MMGANMRYLIVGASRGLGAAFAEGLPSPDDEVFVVSRSKPNIDKVQGVIYEWISADATSTSFANDVADFIGNRPIDVLIYNAGIWEKNTFESMSVEEIDAILTTNLISCIQLVKRIFTNVVSSGTKTVILISSTCGLENEGSQKIAYVASKFGLRGVGHALRELLRDKGGKVTVISPGSIASDVKLSEGVDEALERHNGTRIPVNDFVELISTLLRLSPVGFVKEIHFPAVTDSDV